MADPEKWTDRNGDEWYDKHWHHGGSTLDRDKWREAWNESGTRDPGGWGKNYRLADWFGENGPDSRTQVLAALTEWMYCMFYWGRNVRQDIIRLERLAGVPAGGDPGDPPPPPPLK